jgi:hypothetical protein
MVYVFTQCSILRKKLACGSLFDVSTCSSVKPFNFKRKIVSYKHKY